MKTLLRTAIFTPTVVWILVFTTFIMGWFPPEGQAMLAPGSAATLADSTRAEDTQTIQRVLENKIVQQRLEDYGLTPDEINVRLARLSDAQVHQMASKIDALTPGGDGLGIIIALLVIAILVVIFIYLLDHRIEIKKN